MTVTPAELAVAARVYREETQHLVTLAIYFIREGDDGPIKIGKAKDPAERLATLQCGNPRKLHLVAVWRGFAFEERDLHAEFAEARITGEWFEPVPELLELVDAIGVDL